MNTQIITYNYEGQPIEFDLSKKNLMVNATEMAKPFGAQIAVFMRNKTTQRFIEAAIYSENSHYILIKSRNDLYTSSKKSGTWMHQILALEFAV